MDIVLLFPGQGSQKPGMGKDLAEVFPAARQVFKGIDDALGESLSALCFDGPADTLTLTNNAQPALYAHGAAAWAVVGGALRPHVVAAAGHSLGEFTAYHAAGAMSLASGAQLVRTRGELMRDSGLAVPGTMAAVLGDLDEPVESICARVSASAGVVVPANYNSPGQVVISGEVAAVEQAMEECKRAGARRVVRLAVSGAFHSPLMAVARDGLADALSSAEIGDPTVPVCANVTAEPVVSAHDARRLLLEQLTAPVRWTEVMTRLAHDHPDAIFVEIGPGAVLAGLARKIVPGREVMSCGTATDVAPLLERVGVAA
ncbi:MAG TPA: ACP S-malonyltransferase [Gemmatimonadaceae bacterium]|nr:ACP S-malonyltransferase [Gemmatimonadaceae bacterium]